MNPNELRLEEVRIFLGQLPQAAAIVQPTPPDILLANPTWTRRFAPGSKLPFLEPHGDVLRAGLLIHERFTLRASPFPLVKHPDALLVQDAEIGFELGTSTDILLDFPLGIVCIDRTLDRAVLINRAFWDVWRLPVPRQTDQASTLRATCRGFVTDPGVVDLAWPAEGPSPGRFRQAALTDGRDLRIATFDRGAEFRWVIAEDVTLPKRERLAVHAHEIRSQESQRLESLSLLAGGIAHDFNNLLLVILANAELLREEGALDAAAQSAVTDIRVAAERASDLSIKMLAYSGRGHMVSVRTSLEEVLRRVIDELFDEASPRPEVVVTEALLEPAVMGDPEQLHQLFTAILLNAQESPGVREIGVRIGVDAWTTEGLSQLYLGDRLTSGPYAEIMITDDGEGIDKATLARLFDPFFSTRGPGRGLGLAAAAGIARGHGGTIDVESVRGEGACFRVLLPVIQPRSRTASHLSAHKSTPHEGTVLLVDDESLVRRSARQALEQAGFLVVEAETGEQALDLFARQPDRFNLVIMDISMPGAPGDLVAKEMRAMTDPPVPLVLSSGYRPQIEVGLGQVADHFLQKPYRRAELVQTARALLQR